MGDQATEKAIFEAFILAEPNFADEPIASWHQPKNDPPDILCITSTGRRIGVELADWVSESQISKAKGEEASQRSVADAIGAQPENKTANIYFAELCPKPRIRLSPVDKPVFRSEPFDLISHVDSQWGMRSEWHSPQGCWYTEFSAYPTLGRYLTKIVFSPRDWYEGMPPNGRRIKRTWPPGSDWLVFEESKGGAYSEHAMVGALLRVLCNKIKKYEKKPPTVSLDDFYLLVYYSLRIRIQHAR
jgi:hypothetical protein